jgi:hypothetical protein
LFRRMRQISLTILVFFCLLRRQRKKNLLAESLSLLQGDQIGRIFAHWATVFFWQLYSKKATVFKILRQFYPRYKLHINFEEIRVGSHFGRVFNKLIWSPCSPPSSWLPSCCQVLHNGDNEPQSELLLKVADSEWKKIRQSEKTKATGPNRFDIL